MKIGHRRIFSFFKFGSGLYQIQDADARAWCNHASVQATTPAHNTLRRAVDNYATTLKSANIWTKIYRLWICVKDSSASSVDLKARNQRFFNNGPTFNSTYSGMDYNGTNYAECFFLQSAYGSTTDHFMYTRLCQANLSTSNAGSMQGCADGFGNFENLVWKGATGGTNIGASNMGGEFTELTAEVATSLGKVFYFNRTSASDLRFYKDGVQQTLQNLADGGSFTGELIYHMCTDEGATPVGLLTATEKVQAAGSGMSAADLTAFYNADSTFWTALGYNN